ncbi:hypothetical protein CLOM_g9177 [Closterium sp. NIES-68]|nr:hypothetical protein CLOM_g9177 [Closterium sp. NIES-68]GJP77580.1 hypothetical protein CLOP_g7949 [Closterium sp. NIES-67]GJP86766.1 hypothetical protein CLOP_g16751 [Closterium sp. NIES-67]
MAAKRGTWRCPRCDDVCPCNKCVQRRSKDGRQRRGQNQLRNEVNEFEPGKGIEELHISNFSNVDGDCTPGASNAGVTSSAPQDDEAYEGALGLCAILKKDDENSLSNSPSESSDNSKVPLQHQGPTTSEQPRLAPEQPVAYCFEEKDEPSSPAEVPWTPRKSRSSFKRDSAAARFKDAPQKQHAQASPGRGDLKEVATAEHQVEENYELSFRHKLPRYSVDEEQQQTLSQEGELPLPLIRGSRSFTYRTQDGNMGGRSNIGHDDVQPKFGLRFSGSFDAFQYATAKGVSESSARERFFSVGRLPDSLSPRSASVPHTPVRRKLSRKGIPSRGDSGIEFSPLIGPSSPCKPVSPCVLPQTAAGPPANRQLRMRISAPGLDSDERCTSEVSIEKLETLRPGFSKEDGATSSFQKHVQRRFPEDMKASSSPGTPSTLKAGSDNLSGGPSTSRSGALGNQERIRSDKKVAAAVAAALKLCVPEIAGSGVSSSYKASSSSSDCSEGVGCQEDSGTEESPPGAGKQKGSATSDPTLRRHMKCTYGTAVRKQQHPGISPYDLVQEGFSNDPWKLLVASMLLEEHPSHMVRHGIVRLFQNLPSADDVISSDMQKLGEIVSSAGFHKKWAKDLLRFSREFSCGNWVQVSDLPGVGRYATDSYAIFCEGRLQSVHPTDSLLQRYKGWALSRT